MRNKLHTIFLCTLCLAYGLTPAFASEDSTEARQSVLYLRYYLVNNSIPYLGIAAKNKMEKGFVPVDKVKVSVYLNGDADPDKIGEVVTNEKGEAKFMFPPAAASKWLKGEENVFHIKTAAAEAFDAAEASFTAIPSKLDIDTGEGRTVKATLLKWQEGAWVPMPEVDIRLAIKRLNGNLNIGEEESFTSDSTGMVEGEFKRDSLPGDGKGSLEIVAMVDDNDEVGTLQSGMQVPWGVASNPVSNFDERSLWATGSKAPIWLLVMALACIIGVWAVVIYLISRIIKIRKLGIQK